MAFWECVNSAHVKLLKNGGRLNEIIPCQPDTGGVTSMTIEHIKKLQQMFNEVQTFNKTQVMEAFYWMILGDGCIERPKRGNYKLAVSHKIESEDYIIWKSAILNRALRCSIKPQHISGGFSNGHDMFRLRSQAHPWFTNIWDRIYGTIGRKSIDSYAISLLGPLGLAILYQDDGSYHYSPSAGHNILIHKLCFSKFELEALAKHLVDKFGIIFRINRVKNKGLGYRLRLRAKDRDRFFSLIYPYIVPSMLYKVEMGSTLN